MVRMRVQFCSLVHDGDGIVRGPYGYDSRQVGLLGIWGPSSSKEPLGWHHVGAAPFLVHVALRGLELQPDEAILHFNLACYLSMLGEFPEAKKHLNKSIKLDKRFQEASVEDEDLAGLWDWFGEV